MRAAGKEYFKLIGKKILSGDFNLMRTSFPIKCMSKNSQLEMTSSQQSCFSVYLNHAALMTSNSVERIKLLVTANIIQ